MTDIFLRSVAAAHQGRLTRPQGSMEPWGLSYPYIPWGGT